MVVKNPLLMPYLVFCGWDQLWKLKVSNWWDLQLHSLFPILSELRKRLWGETLSSRFRDATAVLLGEGSATSWPDYKSQGGDRAVVKFSWWRGAQSLEHTSKKSEESILKATDPDINCCICAASELSHQFFIRIFDPRIIPMKKYYVFGPFQPPVPKKIREKPSSPPRLPRGICGKLIVATGEAQLSQLHALEMKVRGLGELSSQNFWWWKLGDLTCLEKNPPTL